MNHAFGTGIIAQIGFRVLACLGKHRRLHTHRVRNRVGHIGQCLEPDFHGAARRDGFREVLRHGLAVVERIRKRGAKPHPDKGSKTLSTFKLAEDGFRPVSTKTLSSLMPICPASEQAWKAK